jgi:hypothetical protein
MQFVKVFSLVAMMVGLSLAGRVPPAVIARGSLQDPEEGYGACEYKFLQENQA